jgi:hypothetical protein
MPASLIIKEDEMLQRSLCAWVALWLFGVCYIATAQEPVHVEEPTASEAGDQVCQECLCDDCCSQGWEKPILSWIAPSDRCYSDFISPMTNPVFFEDPRTLTEVRAIFVQHRLPLAVGGNSLRVVAAQARVALTDRLSIIATKDGFIFADANAILDDGWADVAAGLKYNLYKDPCQQRILSAGFTYEMPVGTPKALQGNGDGEFNLFVTGGTQIGANGHYVSAAGIRLPANPNQESSSMYWSNHFDRRLVNIWDRLYAFTEFNWYHWIGSGAGGVPGVEGLDFFNLGSTGVAGNDIVTGAFGLKVKTRNYNELGVAWEAPLTTRRDVIDNRLTVDWIIRC